MRVRIVLAGTLAASLHLAAAGSATAQSIWVHAKVQTQFSAARQVSTFQAIATTDREGQNRVAAARLCVEGVAHRVQKVCESDVSFVEIVEVVDFPTAGAKCAEAIALGTASPGADAVQVEAKARTCP
jgi:hypothetical protein